jgi:hypothetical protein
MRLIAMAATQMTTGNYLGAILAKTVGAPTENLKSIIVNATHGDIATFTATYEKKRDWSENLSSCSFGLESLRIVEISFNYSEAPMVQCTVTCHISRDEVAL